MDSRLWRLIALSISTPTSREIARFHRAVRANPEITYEKGFGKVWFLALWAPPGAPLARLGKNNITQSRHTIVIPIRRFSRNTWFS